MANEQCNAETTFKLGEKTEVTLGCDGWHVGGRHMVSKQIDIVQMVFSWPIVKKPLS